jgi:hypothetical protein
VGLINSVIPNDPPSRPSPLCLKPPNGASFVKPLMFIRPVWHWDETTFDWLKAIGDDVHAIPVTRSSVRRRSAGRLADGAGSCSRLPAACKRRC